MRTAFICPFNLDRLTGTPIRTKHTIIAVATFSDVCVVAAGGGLHLHSAHIQVKSTKVNRIFYFIASALKELKEYRPDVLHCISTLSVIPAVLYKFLYHRSCNIIFEIHGWSWYESKALLPLYKRVIFLVVDLVGILIARRIISMSVTQKQFLQTFAKYKHISVIWGPTDFNPNYDRVTDRDVFKVGYLGNCSFWQGLDQVCMAAELAKNDKDIIFEVGGFEIGQCASLPQKDNIIYTGVIKRDNVRSFICDKDVMLSPRIKGRISDLQYPQKLSEYLMCGRPVIVSNVSDQGLIVTQAGCGIVLDDVNPMSLYTAIKNLHEKGKEDRFSMGVRAADFACKEFSVPEFTKKITDVYQGV